MLKGVIAVMLLAQSAGAGLAQDAAAGEQVFKRQCSVCHDAGEGAQIKLGPPQNGLEGRKAGNYEGYNASDAIKASGIVWNEQTFKEYLSDPTGKVPGTRMVISVKNEQDVANLWAYLKQFGPDGKKK